MPRKHTAVLVNAILSKVPTSRCSTLQFPKSTLLGVQENGTGRQRTLHIAEGVERRGVRLPATPAVTREELLATAVPRAGGRCECARCQARPTTLQVRVTQPARHV